MDNPFARIEGLTEREQALGFLIGQLVFVENADKARLAEKLAPAGISAELVDGVEKTLRQCRCELNSQQATIDDLLRTTT
jgi:hypothetical protein